ncbi:ATP-binding protein [Streptomyces sp. ME02-6991-2A]|uniref:ATP-binding protein n=1 Tax=Streptomyces sp. ME02-6991-2A TaxID=3028677 RepID=UPI0029AB66E1|nr:ATP-binding protein [Streptomyces sp. ME02-6991-2A]MDX3374969.1 ATP-binding protein [Streptomyces sp. ME02-6991-2A]
MHENSIRLWCAGGAAPRRVNTEAVHRLVVFLRREAGEPAEFDDRWRRALEAAQQEADDARGVSRERDERGLFMESINARQFLERPLDGRTAELRLVDRFLGTDDDAPPCLWLQGDPLTGKSALLGRVAQHLWSSPKFDVVGYFVSESGGWDRADHFGRVMARQLTGRRGGRRPPADPEEVPRTELQALFRSAAARSARKGRRLVVVVDGLDQDAAWRGGVPEGERPGTSIASLLPWPAARTVEESGRGRPGKRSVRVIVSSRPTAVPPADVPAEHPLRRAESVRLLPAPPHPTADEQDLRDGLDRLRDTAVGRALVGFLAAAGAGLCADDLAELTGSDHAEIARMLETAWGRGLVPDDLSAGSYVFADGELLRTAWERTGPDLRAECVRRLHAWADSWLTGERAGTMPRYLLSYYPGLLCEGSRLERYVLDPRRQRRLVEAGRLDEALAQLDLLPEGEDRTPEVAARVALSRAVLSGRTRPPVPLDLPRLFALAGDVARARQLALSAAEDAAKAVRLVEVVSVLSGTKAPDAPDAPELAREAVRWAERAADATGPVAEQDAGMEELAEAGHTLIKFGAEEAGRAVLRAVISCEAVSWASRVRAAHALDPERVEWLTEVSRYASVRAEGDFDEQAEALEIWGEMIKARVPGDVALRDVVKDFCDARDPSTDLTHVDLVALGAGALTGGRREQARQMVKAAEKALLNAFAAPEALSPADRAHLDLELSTTLVRVVQALYDVDFSAEELLAAVPPELRRDTLGDDVLEQALSVKGRSAGSSSKGREEVVVSPEFVGIEEELTTHPVRGRHLLAEAFARWEGHGSASGAQGWGLPLAQALAAAGYAEEAVRLVGCPPGSAARAGALAVVALGCAAGGRGGEALRYAEEAAGAAGGLVDPAVRGLVGQAFAHAGAAGAAEEWAPGEGRTGKEREQVERAQASVAVGLGPYDPEAAARIVGRQLLGVNRARLVPGGERHLPRIMGLLLALPDPRRPGSEVCAALQGLCAGPAESIQGWDMRAVLFQALLDVGGCCSGVAPLGGRLDRWERYVGSTPLPEGVLPVAEWAVLRAVRGDVPGARAVAGRASTAQGQAAALAAVATYLAGVSVIVPAAEGWAPQDTSVLRFLALADALGPEGYEGPEGPDPARDEPEARRLVREVLAGEHWRYALPLLPRLAPEALPRLAESGLVHGVAGGGERVSPSRVPAS